VGALYVTKSEINVRVLEFFGEQELIRLKSGLVCFSVQCQNRERQNYRKRQNYPDNTNPEPNLNASPISNLNPITNP